MPRILAQPYRDTKAEVLRRAQGIRELHNTDDDGHEDRPRPIIIEPAPIQVQTRSALLRLRLAAAKVMPAAQASPDHQYFAEELAAELGAADCVLRLLEREPL